MTLANALVQFETAIKIAMVVLTIGHAANARNEEAAIVGPSPLRFGMEIEISGQHGLRNLVPYFDFQSSNPIQELSILETQLSPDEIDSYLTTESFKLLPKEMQDKLTVGLADDVQFKIETKPLITPSQAMPQSQIILRTGPTPNAKPTELRSQGGIILSGPVEQPKEIIVPEIVKRDVKWSNIWARWKALPDMERLKVMKIQGLPPTKIAQLWMDEKIPLAWIQPRKTNTPEVNALLSNIEWENEGGLVEFRHKVPVNGKEPYLRNVELFAEMAGIRRYIEEPNKVFPPDSLRYTYHVHASRRGAILDGVAKKINKLLLLQMHEEGRGEGALKSRFGFSDTMDKGLLRQISDDRIEYRSHVESPRAELERYIPYMSRPAEEVEADLDRLISEKATRIKNQIATILSEVTSVPETLYPLPKRVDLDLLVTLLSKVDQPLLEEDMQLLAGKDLRSEAAQAKILTLLSISERNTQFERLFNLLSKETVAKHFKNLIPLAEYVDSSEKMYRRAIELGINPSLLHDKIAEAAVEYPSRTNGRTSARDFSKKLLRLLPNERRLLLAKQIVEEIHPREYHLLAAVFTRFDDKTGAEIGEAVGRAIAKNSTSFDEFETYAKAVVVFDNHDPFHVALQSAYVNRAFKEKTAWDSTDFSLIDRMDTDQKEDLIRILTSNDSHETARVRAFKRLLELEVPLASLPLNDFMKRLSFHRHYNAIEELLNASVTSNDDKKAAKDYLRSIDLFDFMKYARRNGHKFKSHSLLQELAEEAVKTSPTRGMIELVDYVIWSNVQLYRDGNSMGKLARLVDASTDPEWDRLLIVNILENRSRYLNRNFEITSTSNQAVSRLLERNFKALGEGATDAAALFKAVQNSPKGQSIFGKSEQRLLALFKKYREASSRAPDPCAEMFRRLDAI